MIGFQAVSLGVGVTTVAFAGMCMFLAGLVLLAIGSTFLSEHLAG